ncbi:MAG: OmpP1/FadL family transporter [Flavobacteriaceae bacterium]
MKKNFTFILLILCTVVSAQNMDDVLRYGMENLQGTPRFQAMGGAFGALGGDLSALNINPAGSSVFANHFFSVSGTHYNRENISGYFGSFNERTSNDVDINQVGGVLVFNNGNADSPWGKMALALNYDVVNNFDNRFFASGRSNQGMDNYFLGFANGTPFGSILLQDGEYIENAYLDIGSQQGFAAQQAFLGYYGGLIDPTSLDDATTTYTSNADYTTVDQDFFRRTYGYNSKFTLNLSSVYNKRLHLGAALNFHSVFYEQFDELNEDGFTGDSPIEYAYFDNFLRTEGSGFSFSLGAIAKLNEAVRIGASYQSPTWYRLTDDTAQRINSNLADEDIGFINYDVINLFDVYKIKTPQKLTGSLALVFGKQGLLSFDYSYQDMSEAELRPDNDTSFSTVNRTISNELGAVSTYRVGGEYRIDRFSLRAGYRFEESPFENGTSIGELTAYSGGLGYSFGPNRIDLSVSQTERNMDMKLLATGLDTPANFDLRDTNVSLGYSLNF